MKETPDGRRAHDVPVFSRVGDIMPKFANALARRNSSSINRKVLLSHLFFFSKETELGISESAGSYTQIWPAAGKSRNTVKRFGRFTVTIDEEATEGFGQQKSWSEKRWSDANRTERQRIR